MTQNTSVQYTPATLGLRLGLMTSFLLFGIPPLIRVYVSWRLNGGDEDVVYRLPFDIWMILNGVAAVMMMVAVLVAWRGRPPIIQYVLQGVMAVALMAIMIEAWLRYNATCETCIIPPTNDIFNEVFRAIIPFQIFVAIYTIWYINRAPARRFFDQFRE